MSLTADQENLYVKDLYKAERESYKEKPTVYDKIYRVKPATSGGGDKQTRILGAGGLKRATAENQDINFVSPVEGPQSLVKYSLFTDGVKFSKEAVEDTTKLGNLIKDYGKTWGKQVRILKETLGARPFNVGGNLAGDYIFNGSHTGNPDASGDLLYDNKPLFNLVGNARDITGTGTFYNSIASLSLDSSSDFQSLYVLHTSTNNRDERGDIIQNEADCLLTKVGADAFKAKVLLGSTLKSGSQLNDINPYEDILMHQSWDYLDPDGTENAFFVGKKNHEDFQFHERQAPELRFFRDEDNLGYKASINARFGIMINSFRCWSRGGGTSA